MKVAGIWILISISLGMLFYKSIIGILIILPFGLVFEKVDTGKLLEKRKNEYKEKGVDYYQPWLVLMTDGEPTDKDNIPEAVNKVVNLVNNKKLTVFPIGIGRGANMTTLASFSPNRAPLRLQGLKFKEFFAWLSQSVSRVSQSTPGETIKLDVEGIKGWGEI